MKTASFGILSIKIPDRMLSFKNRLDAKMLIVHCISFFTIKTPRALTELYSQLIMCV